MKKQIPRLLVLALCMGAIAVALHAASNQSANYTTRTLALPDHGKGNITMDYIAYDSKTETVWVPAINIGSVYVVNTKDNTVREIPGFATSEVEFRGRKHVQGPSGVSMGDGVVYIGDRADSSVCAVDGQVPPASVRLHFIRHDAGGLVPLGKLVDTLISYITHFCFTSERRADLSEQARRHSRPTRKSTLKGLLQESMRCPPSA